MEKISHSKKQRKAKTFFYPTLSSLNAKRHEIAVKIKLMRKAGTVGPSDSKRHLNIERGDTIVRVELILMLI